MESCLISKRATQHAVNMAAGERYVLRIHRSAIGGGSVSDA